MELKNKQQIIIKICCVFIAFGLWLYITNTENPVVSRVVKDIKVDITNTDALQHYNFAVVPKEQYTISLTIEGLAKDVYKVKPEHFKVEADMGKYAALVKGGNDIPVTITPLIDNVKVKSGYYTVRVNLDSLVEKTVPVKVVFEGEVKAGYYKDQPVIKPAEVVVSGAAQYVNKVEYTVVKADVKNLDKDITFVLPLKVADSKGNVVEHVAISKEFAEVTIPIKKTKSVGINIKTKGNVNKDIILKGLSAVKEKVEIAGKDSDLNSIASIDTEPIDLSKLSGASNGSTIEVKLILPQNIKLVNNSGGTIQVKVDLGKLIEKSITLNVAYKNLGDAYSAVLEKTQITLVIYGDESLLNTIKPENINCFVDLKNLVEGEHPATIVVDNLPQNVSKVSITPTTIKVTITKKQ